MTQFLKDTRQYGQNLRHEAGVDFIANIAESTGLSVKEMANFYRYGEIQTSSDGGGGFYHTFSPMLYVVGAQNTDASEKSNIEKLLNNKYPKLKQALDSSAGRQSLKKLYVGSDERAKAFVAFVACYDMP